MIGARSCSRTAASIPCRAAYSNRVSCTSSIGPSAVGTSLIKTPHASIKLQLQRQCTRQPRQRHVVTYAADSSGSAAAAAAADQRPGNGLLRWLGAALAVGTLIGLGVWHAGYAPTVKTFLSNTTLGKSGFLASLSLIFLSEIGDKTFFIAALMAMKLGQAVAFSGTMAALSIMSVISVAIGYVCKNVPSLVQTSAPIGEYLGVALLLYFGVKSLKEGLSNDGDDDGDSSELSEAEEEVAAAEKGGKIVKEASAWTAFLQVTSIIFVAEWGDRSMLATIALAVSQSPVGVASGAIAGHAAATVIAILGGTIASQYISEKTISIVGGICFLLFAGLTVFHIF